MEKAEKVALMADFRNGADHTPVSDFYRKISSLVKEVNVLLFISDKRSDINMYDYERLFQGAEVFLVCPEDLTIFKTVKSKVISRFLDVSYDIFFRLHLLPEFTMDTVLLETRSRMYAGIEHPEVHSIDFAIEITNDSGMNGLVNNLLQYVSVLDEKKQKPL